MNTIHESTNGVESHLAMMKKCLNLIGDIAARGAKSKDPGQVVCALQELSQVLVERTGTERIYFRAMSAGSDRRPGGSSGRTRVGGLFLTIAGGIGGRKQQ
jgi:hypothetical protein